MEIKLLGQIKKDDLNKISKNKLEDKLNLLTIDEFYDEKKLINYLSTVINMNDKATDYYVFKIKNLNYFIKEILEHEKLINLNINLNKNPRLLNPDFNIPDFYNDNNIKHIDNNYLKKQYCNHINILVKSYRNLINKNIDYMTARYILPYNLNSNVLFIISKENLTNIYNYQSINNPIFKEFLDKLSSSINNNIINNYLNQNNTTLTPNNNWIKNINLNNNEITIIINIDDLPKIKNISNTYPFIEYKIDPYFCNYIYPNNIKDPCILSFYDSVYTNNSIQRNILSNEEIRKEDLFKLYLVGSQIKIIININPKLTSWVNIIKDNPNNDDDIKYFVNNIYNTISTNYQDNNKRKELIIKR